jgi:hypothetical protein
MRQAMVNANPDLAAANSKYVMRITGDNDEGKAQLDNFIDPEATYPVIACTSRLMSTGVDAQTCHLIVLDRRINSMTEFKQIIGRGTRINEDYNKFFFTVMDFRQVTALFADPAFDGDPVQIYEPGPDDPPLPPDAPAPGDESPEPEPLPPDAGPGPGGDGPTPPTRYYVDNVPVSVAVERVQYLDENGKLITESLTDYTRRAVLKKYDTLVAFLTSPCCITLVALPCSSTRWKIMPTFSSIFPAPCPSVRPSRTSKRPRPNGSRPKDRSSRVSPGNPVTGRSPYPNPTSKPCANTSPTNGNITARNRFRRNTGSFLNDTASRSTSDMCGIEWRGAVSANVRGGLCPASQANWTAPSGLCSFVDAIPRALPWAGMGRRVAAPEISANGAPHSSLGQRPRKTVTHLPQALKGRPNA